MTEFLRKAIMTEAVWQGQGLRTSLMIGDLKILGIKQRNVYSKLLHRTEREYLKN